jgi:hypothetical protein
MLTVRFDGSFQEWRLRARALLQHRVAPHEVNWASDAESTGLFDEPSPAPSTEDGPRIRIPRQLLDELEMAARYRTEQRWGLLYRVLWRVNQGDSSARMVGDIDAASCMGVSRQSVARPIICMPFFASAHCRPVMGRSTSPGSNLRTTYCPGRRDTSPNGWVATAG